MYEDSVDYMLGGTLTLKNGLIDKYYFEDGYCKIEKLSDNSGESIRYYYYDQDHLGNIRQVTEVDENCIAKVVQINNYYPFGMQYCDGTVDDFDQNHKYNGKEYDKMHGLNTYDYGARQYNPVTARWDRMDPLCEKDYGTSPYVYCHDNPVRFVDSDGLFPHEILKFHKTESYRADYYTLTKPAAYLLGMVSGIDVKAIENIHIYERGVGRLYPWYQSNEGGGAITLGSDKYATSVTLTNNFFEDDSKAYNNHGYGQDINAWFGIMSHEVVHLNHIEQNRNIGTYLIGFGIDYLKMVMMALNVSKRQIRELKHRILFI